MVGTQDTMGRGAGTADRVCAVRSIRVRGPSVTETSWGSHRGSSESNSLSGVPSLSQRLFMRARMGSFADADASEGVSDSEVATASTKGQDWTQDLSEVSSR